MTTPPLTFRARPSYGWIFPGLVGILILITTELPALKSPGAALNSATATGAILGLITGGLLVALAVWFPTMRYEFHPQELALLYGPFTLYRIPYHKIKKISSQDRLQISLLSSLRLPGLALFDMWYTGEGMVKMCATSATSRILLIKTSAASFGITPTLEEGFISELKERVRE